MKTSIRSQLSPIISLARVLSRPGPSVPRILSLCLALLSWTGPLAAKQNFSFDKITVDTGLSQNLVECISQDSKGFIWIGTMGGLNRYDGFSLKTYSASDANAAAISNSRIRTIFTDRKGILWVGTLGGGLNKFDQKTERFHHYKHSAKDTTSLSNDYVQAIVEDASGMLWVGTEGGLDLFNPETGIFKHFTTSREVNGIVADETGNLWIASNEGLMMYLDRESQAITWFSSAIGRLNPTSGSLANALFIDSDGVLWVNESKFGLTQISRENQRILLTLSSKERALLLERVRLEKQIPGMGYAFAVNEDNEGAIWIGSSSGLHIREKKKGRVDKIGGIPGDALSLSGGILSIFRDRSGLMWLGTNGFGCQKLTRARQKFGLIKSNPFDSSSLRSESIRSIYEDKDGAVWIGGYGGLDKLDRPSGKITHIKLQPLLQPLELNENFFWTLYEDPAGKGDIFWFGTEGGGLGTFNRRTNGWVVYHQDTRKKGSLSFGQVRAVHRDRTGILWVCTQQEGLIRFDDRAEKFKRYLHDGNDLQSISSDQTNAICQTSQHPGLLWVATNFGLSALDLATERFTSFLNDPKNPKSISNNGINCLYQDRAGRFWLGTEGGLNRVVFPLDARRLFSNSDSVTFIHYTEAHGLPNNFIYGILEDDEGNLWLSTNKGISRFNPETETFRNYDLSDGLQSNEFNRNAYYKNRQGELFFGGIKGLNYFFPRQLKDNSYIPPVVITDFRIFNESVSPNMVPLKGGSAKSIGKRSVWPLQKDIKETKEIVLSYTDKVFSFAFVALDYTTPEKNRFEYMMEGFDDDWVHAGTKREVTYTNLDPGEYTFRVKGSNNDGVWNEEGTSLRITIVPPYWQTWWFRAAIVIALFALAFTGYNIRINSVREQNIVLQKKATALKQATADLIQSRAAALILMEDAVSAHDQTLQAHAALQSEMAERKQAEQALLQSRRAVLNMMTDAVEARDRSEQLSKDLKKHRDHLEQLVEERTGELKKSEEKFRTMADFTYDWEYWIDAQGRMLYVSPSCERITGHTQEEFYKYPTLIDTIVHPDDRAVFQAHVDDYNTGTKRTDSADWSFRIIDSRGNMHWIGHVCHPITGEDGTYKGRRVSNRDITEGKKAEMAIQGFNESLRRTNVELQASNSEIEAFAYSVSHDLRAPLRTIDGFSHALLEDYDDKLGVQGKDYLRRVRASTQRMAQLIDDILKLSRVTRSEMNIEKVNLTQIAWSIINELQKSQPERLIHIKIAEGLEDTADPRLMRVALENLLGNAWKFTGKQSEAVIEFGSTKEGEKKVYFIRDNGAGFDMAYANKLFAPFQRLHTIEEYAGTGIGLATVRRITRRHGGKIWAEGQVDKGATFYFSLQ